MEEVNGAAKLLKKIGWKKEAKVCLGEIVGSLLVAFGTYNFAASLNVPLTGVSGVAIIVYRLFHVPMGWMTVLLNIPLIILCLRRMGKRFLMRSFRSIQDIMEADVETLEKIPEIPRSAAQAVYDYFHAAARTRV